MLASRMEPTAEVLELRSIRFDQRNSHEYITMSNSRSSRWLLHPLEKMK